MIQLPIDPHLAEICDHVASHPITIVEAPPGSGKTTRVAPALMKQPFAFGRRIYLLQPRRLAARSVAERIAREQGGKLGAEIGYHVRFDSKVSRDTKLIVATEGILLRRLQDDPAIDDTSIVLLDEFHERSLDADLLLGMLRRVQAAVRDDLRLVIMSATIESSSIQAKLGNVPVITIQSQSYPVAVRYRPPKPQQRVVDHVVELMHEVVLKHEGDVLAFLPGAGEIHRCKEAMERSNSFHECDIVPLFGAMQLDDQSKAIETGPQRKIVLSTNIAETSLTIEGIRVVVDSGLARVMRYAPEIGLDRLSLESICQASATQRSGRAGRVAPGTCYRLWSEASDRSRPAFLEPEIRRVDIVTAILQLYAWGEGESNDFPWLEPPRIDALERAQRLLGMLGAIRHGKITDIGKTMANMPTHPRLARMILASADAGCMDRACLLAALLSERDPFEGGSASPMASRPSSVPTRTQRRWDSDCVEKLTALESFLSGNHPRSAFGELNRTAMHSITKSANQLYEIN
ncbi:MAG: helicase-related protein, partial [Pirellula sp.]